MEFKTNDYEFECHHGPKECEGNKIQACALKLIDQGRNTEDLGFNKWVFWNKFVKIDYWFHMLILNHRRGNLKMWNVISSSNILLKLL